MRKSFIIHKDSLSILNKLSKEEAGELFLAIRDYQIDKKLPTGNLTSIVFEPFLNQFLRDDENWQKVREARVFAGSIGGKQKVANASKSKQKVANLAVSVSVSDSVSVSKNVSKSFIIPTLQEIQAYCQERKNSVSAEKFLNYYQAKGWMIGKNKMKDWKAAVRTWEGNDKQQPQQTKSIFNPADWQHLK